MKSRLLLAVTASLLLSACTPQQRFFRGATPSSEYHEYSVFFTPTHRFDCVWENAVMRDTAEFIPGAVYGATSFNNLTYRLGARKGLKLPRESKFGEHVIGLRIHPLHSLYVILNPDGEFALPDFPIGYLQQPGEATIAAALATDDNYKNTLHLVEDDKFTCYSEPGRPPFVRINPAAKSSN